MNETDRREGIIERLLRSLRGVPIEGALLTGSMAYGRHHCVTADSDIDILLVLAPEAIREVKSSGPFASGIIDEAAQRAFQSGAADTMWDWFVVDGVHINPGYLNRHFLDCWTRLQTPVIRRNKADKPSWMEIGDNSVTEMGASGTVITYTQSLAEVEGRYVVTKPVSVGSELVADLLYGSVLPAEVLVDSSGSVSAQIAHLRECIMHRYGAHSLLRLLDYALRRASPEFRERYLAKIGCEAAFPEYAQDAG
jgi:predicted nucleotidyltransferase